MIKIDEEYFLNANESCYTLEIINTVQDAESKNYGKESRTIHGYYTTIEGALNGYLRNKTRKYVGQTTDATIQELINYIKNLEKMIKDKFKQI